MKPETRAALINLNRTFYEKFAGDFARTRRSWPPGYDRILPYLRPAFNVVDLGCGNGRLLAFLASVGWRGAYAGVDGSERLLEEARATARTHPALRACFSRVNLLAADWQTAICDPGGSAGSLAHAEAVACLAVLHHIPAAANRAQFLVQCAGLLAPGGRLILSVWQFMSSPRLRKHIVPWSTVGLTGADVETGDYLVSWGEGAAGQRYCAAIDRDALVSLAAGAGLEPRDLFYSDGKEGNLNLYGVFEAR